MTSFFKPSIILLGIKIFIFCLLLKSFFTFAGQVDSQKQSASLINLEEPVSGYFSGRVTTFNRELKTLKIKVEFANLKYLNTKDLVEFWDERNTNQRCKAYVFGRSNDYLLLRTPELASCERFLLITSGAYLKFFSKDLANNIEMGKDVVSLLIKKRMAIQGQMDLRSRELDAHLERVNAVNARYDLLRTKLEREWQKELNNLEEDRVQSLRLAKDLEQRRDEIDKKLEIYKVQDENMKTDRWSLDSRLYYKK